MPEDRDQERSQSFRPLQRRADQVREDLPDPSELAAESGGWFGLTRRTLRWMAVGFHESQANDLAAAVAYYALLTIVPTLLGLVSILGLFMQTDVGYRQAVDTALWIVPSEFINDTVEGLPQLRAQGWVLGLASLAGFLWMGSTFFAALGRAMNQVYRVPNRSPVHQRLQGFVGIIAFSLLFTVSVIAAVLPTALFGIDEHELPLGLERWAIFTGLYRIASYVVALLVAIALFMVIFRLVPAAGQKLDDVFPGALVIAFAFVLLAQVFPVYFRIVSGWNVLGGTAGLLSLVLIWFYILAHLLLFGAYLNATWQGHRHAE